MSNNIVFFDSLNDQLNNGGIWSPELISVEAWLDASDANTITIETGVSQWDDKSGNDRHFIQGTVTVQPPYNDPDPLMNNLPSLGYDLITNQRTQLYYDGTFSAKRVYMVAYYNASTFASWNIMVGNRTGTNKPRVGGHSGQNYFQDNDIDTTYKNGNRDTNYASGVTVLPMTPTVWNSTFDYSADAAWSVLAIGNWWTGWGTHGAISEVIFTDGTEDLATQQKIEGYLAHKWGIQGSLDASHPYKNNTP
jgi:hypothetical protein